MQTTSCKLALVYLQGSFKPYFYKFLNNSKMSELQNDKNTNQPAESTKENKWLIPLMGAVIAILLAFLIYTITQKNELTNENMAQEIAILKGEQQLDSITNELNEKILTVSQLGGDIEELMQIKAKLEEEREVFRKNAFRQIDGLKQKVEGYRQLLELQDVEIAKLKELNEALLTENTDLKVEKNELNASLRDLSNSNSELQSKVALASRLTIEKMAIFGVASGGKEREGEFRNRQVEQLRIEFFVSENAVAPIEGKQIRIRIVAPDKNVLFDVTRGSGSFMFDSREMFYTASQEILYDRKQQKMNFIYEKGSDYAVGQHTVEVFTDDYLMGRGTFVVK
jgi:beta-glucosidase-like glycosyl hydrolase